MANLRRRSRSPSSEYGVADGDTRRPSLDVRPVSSSRSNRYWSDSLDDDYEPSAITINIFDSPSSEDVTQTNVFATPPGSATSSRTNSMLDVNVFSTPTPSLRRHSLSWSVPRSPSPLPVADGGRGSYFGGSNRHQRSFSSISRATTPNSITSGSGWTGPTLNRSNTTGTTNSSTLYSLPSQMTGSSSPPSPIMSNAHARHYGHHQHSLSMHSSELGPVDGTDPFGDGFVVPVGDGFAPRHTHQRRGPASAVGSQASTLPPPYSEYPGQHIPAKIDENAAVVSPMAPVPAFDQSARDATRTAGIGVAGNEPESSNLRGGDGGDGGNGRVVYNGEYNTEDHSGATKEWRDKKWLIGWRFLMLMAAMILAVGIAVGLGVGLGIGLRSSKKDIGPAHSTSTPAPEHTQLPDSETANIFDPDDVFPNLPSGSFFVGPLIVGESNQECVIKPIDASAPDFFREGAASLWTCNIPEMKPFLWNIQTLPANLTGTQISNLASDPKPLQSAEYEEGKWGGYTISSKEGERDRWGDNEWKDKEGNWNMYSQKAWREGLQGPSFWNQPLMFINSTKADDESGEEGVKTYKFGLLYEKQVLLREATMIANWVTDINEAKNLGDGDLIAEGELVWMCSWNKTMFEVELLVDEVASVDTVGFDLPAFVSAYSDVDFDGIEEIFAPDEALEEKAEEYQGEESGEASDTVNYQDGQIITDEESELNDVSVFDVEFDGQLDDNGTGDSGTETETVKDDEHNSAATPTTSATTTPSIASRSSKGPHRYPKKIKIREYRPNINRLKDVQGIDRTEGNQDERAQYGDINCVKMIAIPAHGLRTVVGEDGEGKVTLKQKLTENKQDCLCAWAN